MEEDAGFGSFIYDKAGGESASTVNMGHIDDIRTKRISGEFRDIPLPSISEEPKSYSIDIRTSTSNGSGSVSQDREHTGASKSSTSHNSQDSGRDSNGSSAKGSSENSKKLKEKLQNSGNGKPTATGHRSRSKERLGAYNAPERVVERPRYAQLSQDNSAFPTTKRGDRYALNELEDRLHATRLNGYAHGFQRVPLNEKQNQRYLSHQAQVAKIEPSHVVIGPTANSKSTPGGPPMRVTHSNEHHQHFMSRSTGALPLNHYTPRTSSTLPPQYAKPPSYGSSYSNRTPFPPKTRKTSHPPTTVTNYGFV